MSGPFSLIPAGGFGAGWAAALSPVSDELERLRVFLDHEDAAGRGFLPEPDRVLRAFSTPFEAVRVLMLGQDPYPTPGHPIGLSFAVERHLRPLPKSLTNIYRELHDDLAVPPAPHGDLSAWAGQGVLLLNRVLTVQPSVSGSHRQRGWEAVTEQAIRALVARRLPLIAVLWGRDAGVTRRMLGDTPIIESAHPSPLSASRGFFGSRPFSAVNARLAELGADPIDWTVH